MVLILAIAGVAYTICVVTRWPVLVAMHLMYVADVSRSEGENSWGRQPRSPSPQRGARCRTVSSPPIERRVGGLGNVEFSGGKF
jgi:hypothetical protein